MTVYVVQDHRRYDKETGEYVSVHDLSPASEFGEIKYLLSPTAAPWATESIIEDLWDGLKTFNNNDYLLMVGNPVLCGLATTIACDINEGRIQFLQWNGRQHKYIPAEAQVYDLDAD